MIFSLLFLGFFAFSQAQTCIPETQPIGSFGQGVPRIDGTMVQEGSPYSMIDIDGAAQMPAGIITGLEYRVFRQDRVTFQIWKPLDIVQGRFELVDTVELNPTEVEEVIEIKGLNIPVQNKYRWGFSYNGNGVNVPIKYSMALNEPNKEPYMALQCFTCAAGKTVGDTATFPTGKVQKQFRMRAMMSIVISTCPTTTPVPEECTPPDRQPHPKSSLRSEVFTNYNPKVRPAGLGENLAVTLEIRPAEIISFDGHTLKIFFYMDQRWMDNHLAWCPEDNDMISNLKIMPNEIWTPDVVPYNFRRGSDSGNEVMATLYSDGTVMHIVMNVWDLKCMMTAETEETKDFKCSAKFWSWVHDGSELDFKVEEGELNLSMVEEHPKVKIMSATAVRVDVIYPCCPDTPYPTMYFNVMIRYNKMGMDKDMDRDGHRDMDGDM